MSENDEKCLSSSSSRPTMLDLPEEILLRIFQFLLPYDDYSSIRLVCRQWSRLSHVVRQWRQDQFYKNFSLNDRSVSIHWHLCDPPKRYNLIPRFSHSVCYVDSKRSLFVFGGRRDLTTSLNDFWRLDLSTRSWERILATGHYPPPKCSSTFVEDENGNLILFGGRSMVFVDDVHMREQLHSELHSFSLEKNSWTIHPNLNEPGPICDHSASMMNENQMIVFGGSMINDERIVAEPTNFLWKWTGISTNIWTKISIEGVEPEPRKGHSQFTMTDDQILIVGGSSSTRVCRDVWLFSLKTSQWTQITIENSQLNDFSPSNEDFGYLPFCFIRRSRLLITFSRLKRAPNEHQRDVYSRFDFSHCDEKFRREDFSSSIRNSSSDENDETTRRRTLTTQRRTHLPTNERKYHFIDLSNSLQIYRLDLSNLFESNSFVRWLPSKTTSIFGSPTRSSLFYSLSCARTELILFGGIEKKKLQINRRCVEHSENSTYRSLTSEGTLAFATISTIPL